MGATRARNRALGIHDWDAPEFDTVQMHIYLLVAASQHQAIADAFADFFNTPHRTWEIFSASARMVAFLQQFDGIPAQAAAVPR